MPNEKMTKTDQEINAENGAKRNRKKKEIGESKKQEPLGQALDTSQLLKKKDDRKL